MDTISLFFIQRQVKFYKHIIKCGKYVDFIYVNI
jgi:hypothetical protein